MTGERKSAGGGRVKNMKIKNIVVGLIIIAAVVGSVLILKSLKEKNMSSQKPQQKPFKIGMITYPATLPFFVAKEKGFFAKRGANVEIVVMNDFNQWVSSLANNQIQAFYSTPDLTSVFVDAGVRVKEVFATDVGYGSDGLLVQNSINSLKDLKGQTVYLPLGAPGHFILRYVAKQQGLTPNDLKFTQMEAAEVGIAFAAGKINAGMTWEPHLSEGKKRADGKTLFTTRDYKGILLQTIVVRTDALKMRREEVKALIRGWLDAIEYWQTNKDEANEIAAKAMGLTTKEFEDQVETVRFLGNLDEIKKKFDKSEKFNVYELTEKAIEIFKNDGVIKGNIKAEDIIDTSIIKEL